MKDYLLFIIPLLLISVVVITLNIFFLQTLQTDIVNDFNNLQLNLTDTIGDAVKEYFLGLKRETILISSLAAKTDFNDRMEFQRFTNYVKGLKDSKGVDVGILEYEGYKGKVLYFSDSKVKLDDSIDLILKSAKFLTPDNAIIIEAKENIFSLIRGEDSRRIIFLSKSAIDLANQFINKIQHAKRGNAWILTGNGALLYHPVQPDMVGRNIFTADETCFKCHHSFEFEQKVLKERDENSGKAISPLGDDRVIAYSKVNIDTLSWSIFLSANFTDILHITDESMKLYSYLTLSILSATVLVAITLFIYNRKIIQARELQIKEENMRRYAEDLEREVEKKTSAIVREREKLKTILNAIGGGIILIDKKGKILWANEKIKEIFNMEVTGKHCEELWTDCDISSTYAKDNIETTIIAHSTDRYFQMITAPIRNERGEIYRYIRLIQDITEIKKMEEQIVNSEKLASIGRLATGIAHEIGNPLTSIFSYVQILKEIEDDDFKKKGIETILFHIKRISDILKQLSGFSKMPSGELQTCSVNDVIEISLNLVQYDKSARRVEIIRELAKDLPEITTDTNQLSQVFINLILNAIDAMPEGGKLYIRSYTEDGNIVVEFKDTGVGIPRENLFKIFDPFFTTKEKGTGLGLAVSYNIIKKMKGSITVDSELGKGSLFKVSLPLDGKS